MNSQAIRRGMKLAFFITGVLVLNPAFSQIRLLPIGNSITWGVSDRVPPVGGEHGYRDHLYNTLVGNGVVFTGPTGAGFGTQFLGNPGSPSSPDAPYYGYYVNGAPIEKFLPDSTYDVVQMLDDLGGGTGYPDIVLLHAGTNDMFQEQAVGDYLTPGTIVYELKLLMDALLAYTWNGGSDEIEQIFLAKIIPRAPYSAHPGINSKILDYNTRLQDYWVNLGPNQSRVTLVNMYSPFYANQSQTPITYYNEDIDATHPNTTGYIAMARHWADYILDYLAVTQEDQFARAVVGPLDGTNNWMAANSIQISNIAPPLNESPAGGAIYSNSPSELQNWDQLALWNDSEDLNTAILRVHPNSSTDANTLSGVGLLFGMSSTSITGNGYMAFVRNNTLRVFVMDTGVPNKQVGTATINNLQPGDSLRVTYTRTDGNNLFTFQRNNDQDVAITPTIHLLTEGSHHYYTGIVFRGDGEDNAILVDWFRVRSRNVDRLPPGQISNLAVTTRTSTTISLQWTATGDNGNEPGAAAAYDLRYSRNPITSLNFNNATIIPNVPPPKLQGSLETLTVTGLLSGHRYYFAVKAMDLYGNSGLLSNVPSEETSTEGQLEDSLATLKNWIYDPAEYGSVAGEMTNLLNDPGEWGSMAVYKGRANPTIVKLVWGGQSQNPPATPSDIENGGFILLASDTSTTAHGYFLFVRTQKRLIYLWDIEFGVIDDFVKAVEYDYAAVGRNPGPGDTLTVIIDLPDGSPPKFDLYVNDKLASKRSIYDERPEEERPPITSKNYAGVILSRQQTVRNNNIESFIVSGETTGAAGFAAEDYAPFYGTVDQWLGDSLEVCKVKVQDDNFVPLAGVPVFFNVKSGGGKINRPYTTDNNLRFEAEWGRPVAPMVEYVDAVSASNGKYVASVQQGGDIRGYVTFSFNALQSGPHYIWGRVRNINYPQFRYVLAVELVDYSPEGGITWEILDHLRPLTTTNTFQWDRVNPGGQVNTPYEIPLVAGQRYTLRIWTAHKNVQLDKLLITSILNYTPSGLEPDNIPKTDATGIASTGWKIGTVADELGTPQNEGLNRLEASLLNLTSVVTFEATGRAGSPKKMTKLTDNLDGASGDTLGLTVQLFDKFNNKAPNNTVQFGVILGDGWLVPGTSTGITDIVGKITTQLVLGAQDTLFTVRAQYTSADTTLYQDMKAVVTTGSVSKLVSLTASRKFYINEVHPNHLQVKVTDDQNVPIPNIPVRFVVTQGNAHVGATAKYTNASGISADTLWIGRTSSIVKVEARTSRLSKVVIAGDSVFYKGEKLKLITQGSKLLYTNNPQSVNPIRMRVLNNLNQTIQDNPVTFVAEGGGFRFPNGSTVLVDTTDATGEASTHVVAGGIHGTFTGVIRVGADNGFYPLSDSPVLLDYQVKSEANSLVKVEGDSATGIVGTMLPELLKVRMLKANGLPIGNQPVTFRMLSGGGSFDDEVAMPQKDILCDPNGYGWVVYWLGSESATDANPYNNRVVAYTKNVDDSISTVFYLSAKSSEADTIKAESVLVFEQIVGQSRNMQVRVFDAQGNKVQNAAVKFTVLAGGGKLGAGTADSTITVFTNSQGLASVLWTLGPKSGTRNNVLEARATNGPTDLRGSPILFTATAKPGPVSGSRSTLAATSPVHAVPDSICTISVQLLDSYGNPVPNKIVNIDVKGDKWDVWQKQTAPTDTLGKATSFLQSPTAGEKLISAIVSSDTLSQRAKVIFLANDATTLEFYSGGGDTANVGTVLKNPFVIQITDGFNPVEFGPVYFTILGNKGSIVEPQPVVSDSSGLAMCHLKLDTLVGVHYVKVSSPGLLGNPIFEATAKIGEATDLVYPAPGYDWDLSGAAGERLPIPFEAMVVEIVNGDTLPVFGEPVTFAILAGETDARVADAQPVRSDAYGIARSHVIADTRSGRTAVVSAEHSDIFYKKWYSVTSFAGPARKMVAVSQTQWTPSPGEEITLEVRVTDKHSNPSNNVTVEFDVMEGDATLLGNATPKTDVTGKASVTVKTGSSAGLVKIWAMGITLEGSPVEFVLNVNTNVWDANSITVYPLSAKQMIVGAVNQFLPDSLRAMVIDEFGNGVSGQYVIFTKIAGDGWLENEYGSMVSSVRVANDEMGVASVRFKCGSIPEVVTRVLAEWSSAKKDTFKIRAVNNPNFPKLDKTIIFNQYPDQIVEGQYPPFKILLRATDLDLGLGYGDKLTFQIGNLFPSEGMEILPQSDTSAYFQWTPNYDQSGWHTVTLKVIDGRGGWDQKSTNLYVQDKNRLPLIMRTIPAEDTSFTAGQTITFWVDARDQDGDPLSFAWRVNDQVVAGTQPVFFYQVPKTATPGSYTVDVFVSDPVNTISHRWVLSVSSSVTLAEFIAEFLTERSSVRIMWKTSHEVDNFGFDVYRSLSKDGEYIKLNDEIIPGSEDGSYLFVDQNVEVGRTYYYKLINTDARGNQNESSVIAVKVPVPSKFELSQNYPNPFNPVTTIRFQLPKRERVVLTVYNMLGQKIATLIDGEKDPGYYTVEWDGKDSSGIEAATGLYIYRLQSQERSITKRMIKLK